MEIPTNFCLSSGIGLVNKLTITSKAPETIMPAKNGCKCVKALSSSISQNAFVNSPPIIEASTPTGVALFQYTAARFANMNAEAKVPNAETTTKKTLRPGIRATSSARPIPSR
ncbi:MAG: hypothetical protein ACTSYD_06085 [Candidatus Heimdallarchaeaceae archaeon]